MNKRDQRIQHIFDQTEALWVVLSPELTISEIQKIARRLCRTAGADPRGVTLRRDLPFVVRAIASAAASNRLEYVQLYRRLTREVIKRGYLDGRLKDKEKPPPTTHEKQDKRLKRIDQLIDQWERKAKRASNAVAKLKRERTGIMNWRAREKSSKG